MKLAVISLAIATTFAISTAAFAGAANAPGQNRLKCFDGTTDGGYGGTCVAIPGPKSKQVATLITNGGTAAGEYAGVYFEKSPLYGKFIGDVENLAFSYSGTEAGAGAPRFSIPVDTDDDGAWDYFAFVSALNCNDGAGRVDVINDSTCTIYVGEENFVNWAAFAAAHPTWTIADDASAFVIADEPGEWTISKVNY